MCWPAYAGLLTTLGLGFLTSARYLFAITGTFLLLSVGALAFRAPDRRSYNPAVVGVMGAAVTLAGKFYFESAPAMYSGLTLLVIASVWNSWPHKVAAAECPKCVPSDSRAEILSAPEK
jgi:hypothetical protein